MPELNLTAQQKAVVDNRGGTLLVSAAAGSGKTRVLVERVLNRIVNEGKNINDFLIITFTNAAASELRSKISAAITEELVSHPDKQRLSRQLVLLSLSHISTVHAFCGELIREYGYHLEIPSDFQMIDDAERSEMLNKQLDSLLEDAYIRKEPGFLLLSDTLGAGRNDKALGECILSLYETSLSQPDPIKWVKALQVCIPEEVDLAETTWGKQIVHYARAELEGLIRQYTWAVEAMRGDELLEKKYLPCYEMQLASLKNMLAALDLPWNDISDKLQMEFPLVRVTKYPDMDHLKAIQAVKTTAKTTLETLRRQFSGSSELLRKEQSALAPALKALSELVLDLDKRFSAEKRRKNVLDFSDQEHLAIRLLVNPNSGRPSSIAREISSRFSEIMVDEYQDSNHVQETIFRAIAAGNDENRVLVGDVKQSIYGFRNAEPMMFLEKYRKYPSAEHGVPSEPRKLILSKNFRSMPGILEAVNHTFATVMSESVGGLEYGEAEGLYAGFEEYPQMIDPCVELHILETASSDGGNDEKKQQKEAEWVARHVVDMLSNGIKVRGDGELRNVKPEDIAILLRSRTSMSAFSRSLRAAGLPVAADTEENIFDTPEVRVLFNLMKVLNNPHQDIPLLAVLCSPVFRFSNEQLAAIRASSGQKRFFDAMRECPYPWSQSALDEIVQLRREAGELSADSLIWKLIHETGLIEAYSAMDDGARRRNNLLTVYQYALNCAAGQHLELYRFLRMLERAEKHGTLKTERKSQGIVLTTIHKSKGLEYPVVILPCLSQRFNMRDLSQPLLVDSEMGVAALITDSEKRIRYPGICHIAQRIKKEAEIRSEEMRLLYVAMTRAKDRLVMTYADRNPSNVLSKLLAGTGLPADTCFTSHVDSPGKWILLAALNRTESGALFAQSGRPDCRLSVSDYPWAVTYEHIEKVERKVYQQPGEEHDSLIYVSLPSAEELVHALTWKYKYIDASRIPSKLTATQMKGRRKDIEAAEGTIVQAKIPQILSPDFVTQQRGLTATERGTAIHLFLQYADYSHCISALGIKEEKIRLEDNEFLTEQQLAAVDPDTIIRLFTSSLGQRLLKAENLIREFKFSILQDASRFFPNQENEEILLQGVVDAAWIEPDGICVLDFKSDLVSDSEIYGRAEYYREQLNTYKTALERIFRKPVKEMYLYFLSPGKEVLL